MSENTNINDGDGEMKKKFRDASELPIQERSRVEKLTKELNSISPFDINAKEVEPLWFVHPKFDDVFCKIGATKDGKRIISIWVTMTTDHENAVFLTLRRATKKEGEYFRSKTSNA